MLRRLRYTAVVHACPCSRRVDESSSQVQCYCMPFFGSRRFMFGEREREGGEDTQKRALVGESHAYHTNLVYGFVFMKAFACVPPCTPAAVFSIHARCPLIYLVISYISSCSHPNPLLREMKLSCKLLASALRCPLLGFQHLICLIYNRTLTSVYHRLSLRSSLSIELRLYMSRPDRDK